MELNYETTCDGIRYRNIMREADRFTEYFKLLKEAAEIQAHLAYITGYSCGQNRTQK